MTFDPCITGFQENVSLKLSQPVEAQLRRRRLFPRRSRDEGDSNAIKQIIEKNASLRVNFGWSFESSHHYQEMMSECIRDVIPLFSENTGLMTTDGTCSWIGFVPHNSYDKEVYKDMSVYSLILYNNEIIDFQIKVIEYISNHKVFRQHAIMRDNYYRFDYFKDLRKNRAALAEAYQYYMDAIHEICLLDSLPRDMIEEQIGCHFNYQPDLFFELLEFSILKGEIYG